MEFLQKYNVQNESDGVVITLFISQQDIEFASELGNTKKSLTFNNQIKKIINEKFKSLHVKKVNIMAGSLLVTSLIIGSQPSEATNFNMGYVYFGGTDTFVRSVDRTEGVINVTSPSYFDINADGTLDLTSKFDVRFVQEMHNRGIKVVPFLSNHWDRDLGRKALENREVLAQQIADTVEKYNLDGVNVDIENVTDVDKDNYTDLVRLLRQKIPAHKEVSVAVAANPNGWTKGWHGSYDYNKLAQYSDYLMIMAYDESYQGGPAGPVASISFVERSIQYALSKGVPADKIVLGLPHYGRYWVEGQTSGGLGVSNSRIEDLFSKYPHTIVFDEKSKSPKATLTIRSGEPVTVLNGKTLTPGTYTIWFENNQSIKEKVALVEKYKLKGTGNWSLGQENASLWSSFKTWVIEPVKMTSLETDIHSPLMQNTAVKISANAVGGNEKLYRFWIRENGKWRILQDYSPTPTVQWTPNTSGDFRISVLVKDKDSTKEYDDYRFLDYAVESKEAKLNGISIDQVGQTQINSPVTVTASGTLESDQLYRFYVRENGNWRLAQDYSPTNTFTWVPTRPGDYRISVHTKERHSTKAYDDYRFADFHIASNEVKMERIQADQTGAISPNTPINFTAIATGGSNKEYRFWIRENGQWRILKDYSVSNTLTWVPEKAGNYRISIHVKDKNSLKEYDDYSYLDYQIQEDSVKAMPLQIDKSSPQLANTTINITANASGSTNVQYRFWVRENGEWRVLQDYSNVNTYAWKPDRPGNYRISVHMKDQNSNKEYDDYKYFDYTIE